MQPIDMQTLVSAPALEDERPPLTSDPHSLLDGILWFYEQDRMSMEAADASEYRNVSRLIRERRFRESLAAFVTLVDEHILRVTDDHLARLHAIIAWTNTDLGERISTQSRTLRDAARVFAQRDFP